MKKTIIVLFLFLVGLNVVFADESGLVENDNESTIESVLVPGDNKTTNLTLSLDKDKYLVGFSETINNYTHQSQITLSSGSIDKDATTVSLEGKTFYFFYKAITDDPNVKFQIAVTPLYLDGKVVTDDSKKIDYTADITPEDVWNGGDVTTSHLDTSGTTVTNTCNLKGSGYTNKYFVTGIAKVVISSNANLGSKVPGAYSGTITVTLQSK